MSRFRDHFRAEIFAETFSKIFFSGPAGRMVALFFALFYGAFKFFALVTMGVFSLAFWFFRRVFGAYRESGYAVRNRTFGELKRVSSRFGDAFERSERDGWHSVTISGTGARHGPFSLRFDLHTPSGAVRVRHADGLGNTEEFGAEEISRLAGRHADFPNVSDFPDFYRNFRTHFL